MALSLFFVVRRLLAFGIGAADILTPVNVSMACTMPFLTVLVIFLNSYCWRMSLMYFSGKDIPAVETFRVYARANIMKYLPGNVGHYAGRQLYGTRMGLSQAQLAAATVLELGYSALAMLLCAAAFSWETLLGEWQKRNPPGMVPFEAAAAGIALCAVLLAACIFRGDRRVKRVAGLLLETRFWKIFLLSAALNAWGGLVLVLEYIVLLGQYGSLDFRSMFLVVAANLLPSSSAMSRRACREGSG